MLHLIRTYEPDEEKRCPHYRRIGSSLLLQAVRRLFVPIAAGLWLSYPGDDDGAAQKRQRVGLDRLHRPGGRTLRGGPAD